MAGVSQPFPLLPARQHAEALAASGDPAGARAVLEEAIGTGRSILGEDHPEVLAAAHQLARLHQQADDPVAARRILEEAYAVGRWRLGDGDPLMLEISYDLGTVAEELGNRHEARKAFARVADAGASVLGADHWAVAGVRAYLGGDSATVRIEAAPSEAAVPNQPVLTPAVFDHSRPAVSYLKAEPTAMPQRRGSVIFAAIAACLAAIIAVIALVVVLAGHESNTKDNVPTLSGRPPTDVRLEDDGSDVRLTWTDPADGRTTFLITGGRWGEVLRPMGQVGPGQTSYELHGLNADLDYCFTVVAVYSSTTFATSAQSCTGRGGTATPK
jgi:Tetratricopeptide repeat